jgi:isocitrate/isopropylmalate dehydrogenase
LQKVAVIPGDGIGPEVVREARKVLDVVCEKRDVSLDFEELPLGAEHYLKTGEVLHDETVSMLEEKDAILLGAMGDPRVKPGVLEKGILLRLRFHFDQYVNLRPVQLFEGVPCPLAGKDRKVDMFFVRENTEDFYVGLGGRAGRGTSRAVLNLVRKAYEARFDLSVDLKHEEELAYAEFAFKLAKEKGLDLVTSVDKANVLTEAYSLWREAIQRASERHGIAKEFLYVDAVALHMVRTPERFKVLVTPNLFGDILTDLGAALQGGLGFAPSGNICPGGVSMFEPVHGSAPDIAGKGLANPVGAILSSALMLETLGHKEAALDIERAVKRVLAGGKHLTADVGGTTSTVAMGDAIASGLKAI